MATNRLTQLIQQLEHYSGVFVLDGVYEGKGLYTLKLQTPRHVYLDTGTFREWITLVQHDIHQSQQPWSCPFCHHQLSLSHHATPLSCPKCSALGWRIDSYPSNVPRIIYDQFCAGWTPAQAYQALIDHDSLFILQETPHGDEFLWVTPSALTTLSAAEEWPQKSLADDDPRPLSSELPVYLDLNEQDAPHPKTLPHTVDALLAELSSSPDNFYPYQFATCYTCRHILEISEPSFVNSQYFCQYPLTHMDSLIERDMIGYANTTGSRQSLGQSAINQLYNLILDHALQPLPAIDDDAFEGYIASLNHFYGPICPRYHENSQTLEFDDLMKIPVTLPVSFGVINVTKLQQQQRSKLEAELLAQTISKLTTLNRNPDMHRLMTLRITKTHLDTPEAHSVIAFMRQEIPNDLVHSPLIYTLKRFFNFSNAAWDTVIQTLRKTLT